MRWKLNKRHPYSEYDITKGDYFRGLLILLPMSIDPNLLYIYYLTFASELIPRLLTFWNAKWKY
jgi:hypothetical protein